MSKIIQSIGILGGGQLGRMFIQNALNYPTKIHILDPDKDAPCSNIADHFTLGDFNDFQTVLNFGKNVDCISIEIENVNIEALKILEEKGKRIIPKPSIIEIFQDKGIQKEFYFKNNLTTSNFYLINNSTEISTQKIPFPFVQKLRKGGYDGKGVQIIKNEKDISNIWNQPSVIEECIDIEKELAVIFCKNDNNQLVIFPIVEMVFDEKLNLVDSLISPANINNEIEEKINILVKKFADVLNTSGIFAIELFLTKNGEILINETAPRVHNSGHHTIEANEYSQFEMMYRVIMNYSLLKPNQKNNLVAMVNLVGENGYEGYPKIDNLERLLSLQNVYLHWYGKKITKAGRKMGHITIIADEYESLIEKIRFIKTQIKIITGYN